MEGALSTQTPRKTTSTAKADMKNMLMLLANCAQQAGARRQSGGGVDDRAARTLRESIDLIIESGNMQSTTTTSCMVLRSLASALQSSVVDS